MVSSLSLMLKTEGQTGKVKGNYYFIKRKNTCYTEWKTFNTGLDLWLWKIAMKKYGWIVQEIDDEKINEQEDEKKLLEKI